MNDDSGSLDGSEISFRSSKSRGKSIGGLQKAKMNFKQTTSVKEAHGQSIFAVQFNLGKPRLFALAGGHFVSVYACLDDGNIEPWQAYADPANKEEEFYAVAWSVDVVTHQQLVIAGGKRGVLRVICPAMASCIKSMIGHGNSVNDLKVHNHNPSVVFSFSKDYTIRAWHLITGHTIAILGGCEGHRSEVLHGDISLDGKILLSCGMDHAVRLWRLDHPNFIEATKRAGEWNELKEKRKFCSWKQHFPDFITREVHGNYIDCARWLGNLILTKSCESCVVLWKPGDLELDLGPLRHTDNKLSILHQFEVKDCNIWFVKFDIDVRNQVLAVGNSVGKVFIFDLATDDLLSIRPLILNVTKGQGAVRQTCFSPDGRTLLCVCDFGLIVRFDLDKKT